MEAVLGNGLFQQFQSAMAAIPEREDASALASLLYYTSTPLTASQADQLVSALRQSSPGLIGGDSFGGFGSQGSIITDRVISAVSSFLAPPQVQALVQLQALQGNPTLTPSLHQNSAAN